ncbi:MAG: cytoplasmic protein [Candidatus Omnitrophica bacterium]|nr:cytoplasmic protein [Candidatus Omnitrophota bacterium]MBU0878354.1 cytoplasmic protein [Candidatus Omnitrophota bacterium]MBU1366857.1 cytoplasmic protein [Candidatus Omnitrophota bacterium]MBU1810482.1 cytoplasmic protein [Candidatus Omnitrophota bacterium]
MQEDDGQYKDFVATRLYCSNCRLSMPVMERLLLILPDGYFYEYICQDCGEVLGDKKVSLKREDKILF